MASDLTLVQITLLSALGTVLLLIPTFVVLTWHKKRKFKPGSTLDGAADVQIDESERYASLVSEQIETRVKQILLDQGSSLDGKIDFGTASDGTLEIWIEEKAYTSVDKIPNKKIRIAVAQAVEEFNA